MKTKAQILTEAALALPIMFLLIVGLIVFAYLIAQDSAVRVLVPALCEAYAESPDITGRVSVEIPYLWLGINIPLPETTFEITSQQGGQVVRFSTRPDRTIWLDKVYPPAMITCRAYYNLRASNAPMLGNITIPASTTYSTVRRYGGVTDSSIQPSSPRQASPVFFVSPLVTTAIIPAIGGVLTLKHKRKSLRLLKRRRGNALVEYALVTFPFLATIISAFWAITYIVLVSMAALGGAKTITLGAMGNNPAVVPVTFSFDVNNEQRFCSFAPGEPVDCYGKSPFAHAANHGTMPSITLGAWQVHGVIYIKYSRQ